MTTAALPEPSTQALMTKTAAARALCVSRGTLAGLVAAGRLSVYSPPGGRARLFRVEVEAIRSGSVRPATAPPRDDK